MAGGTMDINGSLNKSTIKSLRLRMGWSQSDLARRLKCLSIEIENLENGSQIPTSHFLNEMFLLAKQAEACSFEIHVSPLAENMCDQQALAQIEFSQIKVEIE